jgi:hypothetical protein
MRKFIGDHPLRPIADVLETFQPSAVVLRNLIPGSRRDVPGVRKVIGLVREEAHTRSIRVVMVKGGVSRTFFWQYGKRTKYQIATFLATRFPALTSRLPPPRKKWKPEDRRMSIFDAAEIAVGFLASRADVPISDLLPE